MSKQSNIGHNIISMDDHTSIIDDIVLMPQCMSTDHRSCAGAYIAKVEC